VRDRALPARLNGCLEYLVQPVGGNDEPALESLVPLDEGAVARQPLRERVENLLEVSLGVRGRRRVVQRLRFLVERQALTLEHTHTGCERRELPLEILVAQRRHLLAAGGYLLKLREQR
jgi:hypothetical protein